MGRRDGLVFVIGRDAGLALVVSASSFVLPELVAVLLVPIVAAVFRAHQGCRPFGHPGVAMTAGRQILFGSALVTLWLFEGLSAILHFDRAAPPSIWFMAGALYVGYLGLVALALRPESWADA